MIPEQHILIADDYPDARDIWVIYQRSLGYRASAAGDGASAITLAETLLPDLVVLDLALPIVSGFDVARRLRQNPDTSDIPLIAATGYSHPRQLERAREVGFDQIVVTPCDPDDLVEEIERLLRSDSIPDQPTHVSVEHGHNNG